MNEIRKVAFPMIAEYNSAVRYIIEKGLGANCVMQPAMTRRTMELGTKYSPDMVCTPFKTSLGSMIEALEAGADTLVMTFGLCRLGYYGELQEQILRDMGYQFDFINLAEYQTGKKKDYVKALKRINPKINLAGLSSAVLEALKMVEYIDEIEGVYYQNCGFEQEKGEYRKAYTRFLSDMRYANTKTDIENGYQDVKKAFAEISLDKPAVPLRVGVIGEYFTVMDRFSNCNLEQKLADMGVEVHRWMNLSHRNLHYSGEKI